MCDSISPYFVNWPFGIHQFNFFFPNKIFLMLQKSFNLRDEEEICVARFIGKVEKDHPATDYGFVFK